HSHSSPPPLHSCPTRRPSDLVRIISLAALILGVLALVVVTSLARMTAHGNAQPIPASQAAAIVKSGQARSIEVQLDRAYLRTDRLEEHTSELQSPDHLVCRLL